MTEWKRRAGSLALAAGLAALLACNGKTNGDRPTPEAPNGETVTQGTGDGDGGLFQTPTDGTAAAPVTPPADVATDGGTPETPTPPEPPAPPPPPPACPVLPPAPPAWATPDSSTGSIYQLVKYWSGIDASDPTQVFAPGTFLQGGRFAWNEDSNPIQEQQRLERTLLAHAPVDECFAGIGVQGAAPAADGTCPADQLPKKNQAYVWGLTRTGHDLWFGTVANVLCQVLDGMILGDPSFSTQNPYYVCEGSKSASGMGDFRPPHLYRYNLDRHELTTLDPASGGAAALLASTFGFRSAGQADGVVFLAGPAAVGGGINVFAFDADTGDLLGAQNLPQYDDLRTWVYAGGALYAGVANAADATASACAASAAPCEEPKPRGAILRWRGSKADPSTLFSFEVVGAIDNEAANLAFHDGRLFVTTWPSLTASDFEHARPAGLFMSPPLGQAGLTVCDTASWTELWSVADYDPDPIAQLTTAGGALASFGGKLYWGTMSVPFLATAAAHQLIKAGLDLDADGDGKVQGDEWLTLTLGTHRSVAVFTLSAPDPLPIGDCVIAPGYVIELLFGERYLPRYDAALKMYTVLPDAAHQNVAGLMPLRGSSGFGNFFNAYVWSMEVYRDTLYIGTFDWVQVARATLEGFIPALAAAETAPPPPGWPADGAGVQCISWDGSACPPEMKGPVQKFLESLGERLPRDGADLITVACDGTVSAETITGLGNDRNYGIRTMVTDGDALYVGTANAMNIDPLGGWELLRLTPLRTCDQPPPPPPDGVAQ